MCDTCSFETIRFEVIDSRDTPPELGQALVDAATAADKAVTCCLQRKNAIHRAVFDTARAHSHRVAWGYTLRGPEEPDYYLWPADSWRTTFIREYLEKHHATEFNRRDLS